MQLFTVSLTHMRVTSQLKNTFAKKVLKLESFGTEVMKKLRKL